MAVESGTRRMQGCPMQVYWVKLDQPPRGLGLGVGVTAQSEDDARDLVIAAFGDLPIATVSRVHDVASLDQHHVVPNMGSIFPRGIWYPLVHAEPPGR
jgi:hypothetical protein